MAHLKDIAQLRKKCIKKGWTVELTNGGHWKWTHPSGNFFFSAQTPGDYRAIIKIRTRIRKFDNLEFQYKCA